MPEKVVMRHMAIVTGGYFTVGTVRPGLIHRGHHMAIDACFRVIGQVGGGFGYIQGEKA